MPLLPKFPLQFSTGSIVFPVDDRWIIALPDERILSVTPEPIWAEAVANVLLSKLPPSASHASYPDAGIDGLVDALVRGRALTTDSPAATDTTTSRPPEITSTVIQHGDNELDVHTPRTAGIEPSEPLTTIGVLGDRAESEVFVLRALQAGLNAHVVHSHRHLDPSDVDALVGVARWLPDQLWRDIDQWCSEHEIPWHRMHGEGRRWYVGPFSVPGRSPSYDDLRLRRLAASQCPDDLSRIWEWLNTGGRPAEQRCALTEWASDQAREAVIRDLVSYFAGSSADSNMKISGGHHQVGIDFATQSHRRHRVFAVPRNLLRTSP